MFGLGGGFIYSPILLSQGANPVAIASTCLYMILFSASASTLMFGIYGRLVINWTLFLSMFSGTGVLLGLFVMKRAMKKYNRPSIVAFALALAAFIGTILSGYGSVIRIKQ